MNARFLTRRRALRAGLAAGLGLLGLPRARGKEATEPPPVRLITRVDILERGRELRIDITGNAFLPHQVRITAGALVRV